MGNPKIKFTGTIKQAGNINAAYVEFPFSTVDLFNKNGQGLLSLLRLLFQEDLGVGK